MILFKKGGLVKMHGYLNKFWEEQRERIKEKAKITPGQWSIMIFIWFLTSFILTPIGGVIVAGIVGLVFYFTRNAKERTELTEQSEAMALKHKPIQKLIKKKNNEIATLRSKELASAHNAFSVLEELLSKREKDLKELEASGYDTTSKQLLFKNCKVELQQINESLKIATEENIRFENKILKEKTHKKELDMVHKKEVETHNKEVNDRLELLEKAYGAGIINKSEYKKQKSQLLD